MDYIIPTGRVKGEKKKGTFGLKKPYAGKNKNRKGNKKTSFVEDLGHSRIKPIASAKMVEKRCRVNLLGKNRPVIFSLEKMKIRVKNIQNLERCQICGLKRELDFPHHVEQGSKKCDKSMINCCIFCHRLIHEVGYSAVALSRAECLKIAWQNHDRFEELEKLN